MYVWVENPVNSIASGQGNHQRGGIKGKTSDKTGQRAHTKCKKKTLTAKANYFCRDT